MRPGLHQIAVPAGSTDGDLVAYDTTTDELVLTTPALGINAVVATVVNGVPLMVFDDDGTPVTTEVPA